MTPTRIADDRQLAAEAASPESPAKFGHRSLTLDGLRGVAILLVVLGHFRIVHPRVGGFLSLHYEGSPAWTAWLDWPLHFFDNWGWTGVDLFFVLSGFLITGILIDAKGSPGYFRNFYARRALRIFPPYYALLIVTLLVLPHLQPRMAELSRIVPTMPHWSFWAYCSNYAIASTGAISQNAGALGTTWSLAVEEQFYLIWPALAYALGRRNLAIVCVALCVGCPLLRFALLLQHTPTMNLFVEFSSITRADSLAAGGLLALAYRRADLWPTVVRFAWPLLGGAVVALASFTLLYWHAQGRGAVMTPVAQAFLAVRYSLVMLAAAASLTITLASLPGSLPFHALSNLPLRLFGKFSYGIYLYHWPMLFLVRYLLLRTSLGRVGSLTSLSAAVLPNLVLVAATLGITLLSWYALEWPLLQLKRFFPMFESRTDNHS